MKPFLKLKNVNALLVIIGSLLFCFQTISLSNHYFEHLYGHVSGEQKSHNSHPKGTIEAPCALCDAHVVASAALISGKPSLYSFLKISFLKELNPILILSVLSHTLPQARAPPMVAQSSFRP